MTIDPFSAADEFEHADVDTVVIFVDIAGFTAFTEAHGDHRAAELADRFATIAARVLGPGDEMIKTLGDAVMITSSDPAAALAFLRRLHDETRRIDGFPLLRAGICAGAVVKRRGDVFGSTVNTAARLAAAAPARPNRRQRRRRFRASGNGSSRDDVVGLASVAECRCAGGSVRPRRRNPPPGARRSDMSDARLDRCTIADDHA
jgi:Adenylate and Guanylate cyclase catalytic domain